MRFDPGDAICPLLTVGILVALVWFVVSRRRSPAAHEEEARRALDRRVRDLTIRVSALEAEIAKSRGTAPVALVAPVAEPAPAPPPADWIPTPAAPREEPPPLPPVPQAAQPAEAVVAPRVAPPSRAPDVSFETFLGGRVLLIVGVVVVLFGVGFFLKYAIDHEWIGPGARTAMGVIAGIALVVGGDRMRKRGFDVFGQALMGCGLGALYLCNYFACKRYEFIDQTTAFVLTAAMTAAGAALALRRDAPFLAYLGFFGGYLAPAALSDRSGSLPGLTAWLLLVDAGVVVVAVRRAWQGIDLMALTFSAIYFAMWLDGHSHASDAGLGQTSGCLAALVVASLVMALTPAVVRRVAPSATSFLAAAGAGALGALAGHALLFPEHRAALGAGVVGLGALYLLASRLIARGGDTAKDGADGALGLAVAALATAIATVTSGTAVAPSLSIAGLAIVFAGTRTRHGVLLAGGVAMIGLAFADLVLNRLGMFTVGSSPFLSERFAAFASPCVAMLAAGSMLSRAKDVAPDLAALVGAAGLWPIAAVLGAELLFGIEAHDDYHRELQFVLPAALLAVYGLAASRWFGRGSALGRVLAMAPLGFAVLFGLTLFVAGHRRPFTPIANETFAAGVAVVAACMLAATASETGWRTAFRATGLLYLLGLITAELIAWGERRPLGGGTREEAEFVASVWISIAWAIYAASLVAAGFLRKEAGLRWMGLAVFALTLAKVFLVDMAQLEAVYRIGSFLVLGALLVGASFLYQRARRSEPPPT